jgi:predicted transcriptional regulator
MSNILDLTADIVCAHASVTEMSPDELLNELKAVFATLQALDKGEAPPQITGESGPPKPALTIEEAFKSDQVACMICGKTGMKTLKRHLGTAHQLKPGQYKKMFNIPKDISLSAPEYAEKRRQAALDKGLGEKLVAARAARKKTTAKKAPTKKKAKK